MKFKNIILAAAFMVPMSEKGDWQVLKFSRFYPNKVSFSEKGMTVRVKNSSSPLIYPLPAEQKVKKIRAVININGGPKIPGHKKQGAEDFDDFAVKIGLVVSGTKRLNFLQRTIAPKWVKTLFSLAPKDKGINHILFLNMVEQKSLVGYTRVHPLSELIHEKMTWYRNNKKGEMILETELPKAVPVLALWVSSDGDDTKSKYDVRFKEIKLETE